MISQENLKRQLYYHAESGDFVRIEPRSRGRVGEQVGSSIRGGPVNISLRARHYLAQNLAWLYVHGEFPQYPMLVDHINGVKTDNRISNLRLATRAQKRWNSRISAANTSGFKGVSWNARRKKWGAQIVIEGEHKGLGCFDDINDAASAYMDAAKKYHGEFLWSSNERAK